MAGRPVLFRILLLCAVLAPALLLFTPAAGAEGLSFGEDGTLTLLLLSDAEEEPSVSEYYGAAVRALIAEHRPDAVFVLGDTLDGDGPRYRRDPAGSARACFEGVLGPLAESGAPVYTLLSGTDLLTGLGREALAGLIADAGGIPCAEEGGCAAIPVADGEGNTRLVLYCADAAPGGGVGPAAESRLLELAEGYAGVPGVLLTHDGTAAAAGALLPGGNGVLVGEARTDPSFPAESADAFRVAKAAGLFLIAAGGDPLNAFLTHADGVDLLTVPSASYRAESDRETRGAWLVEFGEDGIREYRLRFVPFAVYERFGLPGAVRYFFTTWWVWAPGVKLAVLSAVSAAVLAAVFLLLRKRKPPRARGEAGTGEGGTP